MTRSNVVPGDTRSASEVVGIALLLGIVFIGVSVILVTGLSELGDSQEGIETAQAEQALTEFDSEAVRVATESTASQRIDLGLRGNDGTLEVENASGEITIIYTDRSLSADPQLNVTRPLGTVLYENGDTTVGYQGGGVWRSDGQNSTIVSPPEITYEGNTLTLPVIESKDGGSVHSDVEITPSGPTEQLFPDPAVENLTNKVNTGTFVLIIESRYYEAWGEYFRETTEAAVNVNPDKQRVSVVFRGSSFSINEDAGIISTSGPGEVYISGTSDPSYVDSYDSSQGPYDSTNTTNGVLKAAGDVTLAGNAEIRGSAESEGRIDLEGTGGGSDVNITRDAHAEDGVYIGPDEVEPGTADQYDEIGGEVTNDANVPTLYPLSVRSRVDAIKQNNQNDQEDGIDEDTNRIAFNSSDAQELDPGTYYLDEIDMTGENLFLDARDGPITLAVNNYVSLDKGSKIEVKGDYNDSVVQVYIASRGDSGQNINVGPGSTDGNVDHFYVGKEDKITVKGDASPRFQIIGPADFTGGIDGDSNGDPSKMTGVVFAPTIDPGDDSEFTIKDAEFFGAIVTGNLSLNNKAEVHFDRGIIGIGVPVPEGGLLDFLHITRHEIEVDGS